MKKILFLILLCLSLTGCSMVYSHPTKTGGDFDRDLNECRMFAKQELVSKGICET